MVLLKEERIIGGELVTEPEKPIRIYRFFNEDMTEHDIENMMKNYRLTRDEVLTEKIPLDDKVWQVIRKLCETHLSKVFTSHIIEIRRNEMGRTYTFIIVPISANRVYDDRCEFTLTQMINCCGALVSTHTVVGRNYRGKKVSNAFQILKEEMGKVLGYTLLMSTVRADNKAEIASLKKAKWDVIDKFTNARTNHKVLVYSKHI